MTPDDSKIRSALVTAAQDFLTGNASIDTATGTVSGLPTMAAGRVAWENRRFNPGNKDPWAKVTILPAASVGGTVGHGGFDQETGILQIDINIPQNVGEFDMVPWHTKSRVFFHKGRTFTFEAHSVLVIGNEMSQGRLVEGFFRKSISVEYRSPIKRHTVT